MESRRQAIKLIVSLWSGAIALLMPARTVLRRAYAAAKKVILPKDTSMNTLVNQNPADLDTRNLDITPLNEFGTMGLTRHPVSTATWRLQVLGAVEHPLNLTYHELVNRKAVVKDALLICPGIFAYKARWKGVAVSELLKEAGVRKGASQLIVSGPEGSDGKSERFSVQDIEKEGLLLAFQVNGETLPEKHGFPTRLVAEGEYGSRWVKFVDKLEVVA